jgi:hypothetical protein
MLAAEEIHRAASPIYALCGNDGTLLAGCGNGHVLAWSPSAPGTIKLAAMAPASVFSMALIEQGLLVVGTRAGEFIMIDRALGKATQRVQAHAGAVHAVLALDAGRMATAGADGALRVWHMRNDGWSLSRSIQLSETKLRALALSVDGGSLAVACGDGAVRVLETMLFNEVRTFAGHVGGACAVSFHPRKGALLSGGKDGLLRAWPMEAGRTGAPGLEAHRSTVYGIAFSPDGERLATVSRDKHAKIWDAGSLSHLARLDHRANGHQHSVNTIAWLPHGLYTAGDDRRLLRWV